MSNKKQPYLEEYLYLPSLTHDSAIIAWGGFFFDINRHDGREEWKLLDDDKIRKRLGRRGTIGEKSEPYAQRARVEVRQADGAHSVEVNVESANHAIVTGLRANTTYVYRVFVEEKNGQEREWAAGELRDWIIEGDEAVMRTGGRYENSFTTFPDPQQPTPAFAFAVIGDFGRGVRKPSKDARCQREIAAALAEAVRRHDVRLVLTTGDNIYAKTFLGIPTCSSGDEDDDWFFTYFQPYRYIINRAPVFPAVGNHDDAESEHSVDREQIYDNFYLRAQFERPREDREAVLAHGLFYRFRFGADVEFVCLDTSKGKSGKRHFDLPENRTFIQSAFAAPAPLWRIPFSHHPAYCAGPRHTSSQSLRRFLKTEAPGVRVSFSGHEHNFQYARDGAQHHFLTGGAGKYREDSPSRGRIADEMVRAWGGNVEGHFLLVNLDGRGKRMEITPYGHLGEGKLRPIKLNPNDASTPFVIE
jgi:tartrate-resistant acid phosphatase type 5